MIKAHREERGQALVLIILAIVAIMGFAALAVDMGRVYAERRRAQNAADAASLAWAFASARSGNNAPSTAMNSLKLNDYENIAGRTAITLNHPPASGPYAGDDAYFQVIIDARVDQIFGQFVTSGPYNLTVEAISHAVPIQSVSPDDALVAMGQNICPGIVFNGGSSTTVVGGNIFSNSNGNGPGTCYSGITTGSSGLIRVNGGFLRLAADWENTGGATVDPPEQVNVGHATFQEVPVPVCPHTNVVTPNTTTHRLSPGVYNAPVHISSGEWTRDPGMYCFNADLTINGGSPGSKLMGNKVMIVMYSGSIDLGGSFNVTLRRPSDIVDGAGNHFGGMLIYMPASNTGGIDISGSSGTSYTGTIYAPGPRVPEEKEKCNLGGSGDTISLSSNVLCHTIGIAGNSVLSITYQESENYRNSPTVELSQ